MSELKVYHCNEWHNEYTEFYLKSEADKYITELKARIHELESMPHTDNSAVIERLSNENERLKAKLESVQATAYAESVDAGKRERKLKLALYKACANWAWAEYVRYVDISDGSKGYKQAQERWEKMASKCLKKAEEYK